MRLTKRRAAAFSRGPGPAHPDGNTKTQRHEGITKAPTYPVLNAKPQRRRDAENRTRRFTAQRGPGRRTTAGDRCAGRRLRTQASVVVARHSGLRSLSAGLATFLLHSTVGGAHLFPKREKREAEPTRTGRVGRWDVWPREALALGADERPTGGRRSQDRRQSRRQSSATPHHFSDNLFAPLRLCVKKVGWVGSRNSPMKKTDAIRFEENICVHLCDLWASWGGRVALRFLLAE